MKRNYFYLMLTILCFVSGMAHAQQEDKRMKIEITLKDSKENTTAIIRGATFSYNKPYPGDSATKAEEVRPFFMNVDLEKQSLPLLKLLMSKKSKVDGLLTVTDTYGKLPGRKIEFRGAQLESMSDQSTLDYSSAFITISFTGLTIDGVWLAP